MTLDIVAAPYNHRQNRDFNLKDMVLLAIGTPAAPLSLDEAYQSFQSLLSQLRSHYHFSAPSFSTFENFINKLSRKGFVESTTIKTEDGRYIYTFFLSDQGYREYKQILDEMSSSVRFMDAIKIIRKSFWD